MSPRPTTSTRPQSSPTFSSWTCRRSSPTKSLLLTPTTMTLHSRICSTKHIERKPITLYEKTCLSVCRRRQCPIERVAPLEIERADPLSNETRKHRLGLCSTSKKSKFLLSAKQELTNTNFKQLEPKKINNFFKGNYCSKIWNYVKLIREVSLKWKSYGSFRVLHWTLLQDEDQNILLGLSGRIQELQNEINCMSDSKAFQDAQSVHSGNSRVTSRPVSFPPHPISEGMLRHSFGVPSRREGPPSIWDTHGISGNFFANPDVSLSAPYPQELNQWNSSIEEPLHTSTVEKSERPEQNRDLRCQSGPSAKNSVIFSGGDSSKNYGADQQRLQISDRHFDKFPTPATFACWKIRFKTEVCTCSQFPKEAMQWIKEVEMVIQWMI